jgi:hypothetical protein
VRILRIATLKQTQAKGGGGHREKGRRSQSEVVPGHGRPLPFGSVLAQPIRNHPEPMEPRAAVSDSPFPLKGPEGSYFFITSLGFLIRLRLFNKAAPSQAKPPLKGTQLLQTSL